MNHTRPSFWSFSTALYARDGVAKACLSLQNSYDFDVNMILLCLWFGKHCGELQISHFDSAWEFSVMWKKQLVQPLRNVRTWMKSDSGVLEPEFSEAFQALRNRIKSEELAAERIQQESLERIVTEALPAKEKPGPDAGEDIQSNLELLYKKMNISPMGDVEILMQAILKEMDL